jgi:hypothetical protein
VIAPPRVKAIDPQRGGAAHLSEVNEARRLKIDFETAVANEGGAACDFAYVVDVMAEANLMARDAARSGWRRSCLSSLRPSRGEFDVM